MKQALFLEAAGAVAKIGQTTIVKFSLPKSAKHTVRGPNAIKLSCLQLTTTLFTFRIFPAIRNWSFFYDEASNLPLALLQAIYNQNFVILEDFFTINIFIILLLLL